MQFETQDQHQHESIPDEAAGKLGSAQSDADPFDAAGTPRSGIPAETQAADFMTPDGRPRDVRPREVVPTESR